jgi:hypothetical protein
MRHSTGKNGLIPVAGGVGGKVLRFASAFGLLVACMGLTQIGPCPGLGNRCASNADCDDSNGCTTDTCNNGACSNVVACDATHCLNNGCIECLINAECDDNDGCTTDTCNAGTCSNVAECDEAHCVSVGGVTACVPCLIDAECDDNLECTTDACDNGACTHTPIEGCTERSLATFTDPESDFSTTDVRDVNDEIVNFDTTAKSIIYKTTGVEYQAGQWDVNGNFLDAGQAFEVRFGTVNGEHRAYFTETGSTYICNYVVTSNSFSILPTTTSVPEN